MMVQFHFTARTIQSQLLSERQNTSALTTYGDEHLIFKFHHVLILNFANTGCFEIFKTQLKFEHLNLII